LEYRDDSSSEVQWNDEDDFNSQDDDSIAHENTIIILDDDDESDYESEYDSKSLIEEALIQNKPQTPSKQNQRHFKQNRDAITLAAKNWFDKIVFKGALESVTVTYVPRLTSTAGLTRLKTRTYKGIQSRSASIELSAKLIDDEHRLRSTLMHELCHAAAFLVDGVTKPPHGSCFKKWAKVAMTLIPEITVSTTHSYVTNSHKFAWACTNSDCRIIIKRYSNSVNVDRHVCGRCKSKLIEIEVNSKDPSVIVPKKKREASGFSLYVQQNSSLVRARLEAESDGIKIEQKEVMKELGIMWRRSKDKTIDNV
jgi:predicted SprT family Zn-dependent metalloprotease